MVNVKVCFVELVIGGCHSFLSLRSSERFEPRTEGGTLDRCKLGSRAEGVPVVLSEMFPEGLSMHGYHYLDAFVSESLIGAAGAESLSHALRELPSFQIEWNLELVRRALYPELPSRCQSHLLSRECRGISGLARADDWRGSACRNPCAG